MERLRRLAVLATVLAVTVGPQWCCCTLRALGTSAGEPGAAAVCCCSDCSAAGSGVSQRDPVRTADEPSSCPCRQKTRPAAVAASGDGTTPAGQPATGAVPSPAVAEWCAAEDAMPVSTRGGSCPGRPGSAGGRAVLRALSVLRC